MIELLRPGEQAGKGIDARHPHGQVICIEHARCPEVGGEAHLEVVAHPEVLTPAHRGKPCRETIFQRCRTAWGSRDRHPLTPLLPPAAALTTIRRRVRLRGPLARLRDGGSRPSLGSRDHAVAAEKFLAI